MEISLIVTAVAWFLGGFAVIVTGMGGPLLALPIMAPFTDLQVVILVACFVSVPSNILLTLRFRRSIDWGRGWLMTMASLPGVWAGVLVLKYMPAFWMELGLGILLMAFVLWQFLAREKEGGQAEESHAALAAYGAASGFFSGAVGMGGPPLAVCAYQHRWDRDMARGVFGLIFLVGISLTVVLDLWHGLVTRAAWEHIGVALPAMLAGMAAGLPAAKRLSQRLFRWFMLLVVLGGALTLLHKALLG
ncbi:MAG: sulfite exporter TauE/SafE family protein [Desulfovibrionaceae bacterium]|nr:sulfite exporter TauE/SafE family protein [Desulfovibrionaceae bacterium]